MIHSPQFLQTKFNQALSYEDFVKLGEQQGHHMQWHQRYQQLALSSEQTSLVQQFTRTMNVLCLTGTWCGDCSLQGAAMQRIAEANPERINLRFLLREDEHAEFIVPNQINGGFRVPYTYFMAEDFEPLSRFGDRTLSRYRAMATKQLPEGAVLLGAPLSSNPVETVLQEVLDEFERCHLMLRTSARLRKIHQD